MNVLKRYREAVQHQHGWEIELQCSQCAHTAVPRYEGWTPSTKMKFGGASTIFANLHCPQCSKLLNEEAGQKLVELFHKVPLPEANKRLLWLLIISLVGLPLILAAVIYAGVLAGLWDFTAFVGLALIVIVTQPVVMYFNYKIARLRSYCDCGAPDYRFMGMLGRSYCYRCSTCGKLLRIRD